MRDELPVGATIAGYRIQAVAGRGGMGVVYRAEHVHLGRTVALKTLPADLAENREFRERFTRESRAVAALDHPHIVPVYDAGEAEGLLYLAMRYVSGTDVAELVAARGALDPQLVLPVLGQVADALDAAHAHGVVHRDVKPANVLLDSLDPPRAFLADFGLTKQVAGSPSLTSIGQVVGTIAYMAPEQLEGGRVDGRTDQYALGCMLFECLTGLQPFRTDSDSALPIIAAHLHDPPPRVTQVRPDLPRGLDDIVARALAKDPAGRYPSCSALMGDVERQFAGQRVTPAAGPSVPQHTARIQPLAPVPAAAPLVVPPPAGADRGRGRTRNTGWVLALAGAALVAGAVALIVALLPVGTADDDVVSGDATPTDQQADQPTDQPTDQQTDRENGAILPPADEVAFVGTVEGNAEIYAAAADGEVRNLSNDGAEDLQPDWSPDHGSVLFTSNRGGRFCLYQSTVPDASITPLVCPEDGQAFDAVWSPDGTRIAFALDRDGRRHLAVATTDGAVTELTDGTYNASRPTWTADGDRIIFHGEVPGGLGLFLLDTAGGVPQRLRAGPGDHFHPAAAPVGNGLTFTRELDGNRDIMLVASPGATPDVVAPHPADDLDSDFSPDAQWLAFVSFRDDTQAVWLVRLDGSGLTRLHDGSDPTW